MFQEWLDILYDNIGRRIKAWAKWIFLAEAISVIIAGLFLIIYDEFLKGLLILLLGPIIVYVSTWLLYGFGELIEKTSENEYNTRKIAKLLSDQSESSNSVCKPEADFAYNNNQQKHGNQFNSMNFSIVDMNTITCNECGYKQPFGSVSCRNCGAKFKKHSVAPSGHAWRCQHCGKMRYKTPCEHCGKE